MTLSGGEAWQSTGVGKDLQGSEESAQRMCIFFGRMIGVRDRNQRAKKADKMKRVGDELRLLNGERVLLPRGG